MPVSSRIRRRVRDFLEPDDEIQFIFPADVLRSVLPSVVFVVSRKAITILSTGFWTRKLPKSVLSSSPRNYRLGPVDTSTVPWFRFHGVEYEIIDEYIAVINAADAEMSRSVAPPDPLPHL